MASRDGADGISQLTELLRSAPAGAAGPPPRQQPTIDPVRRRRRRRLRLVIGLVVTVIVVALLGSYADFALTAPVGRADAAVHAPTAPTTSAAAIALPQAESAVSVSGGDAYLGSDAAGVWKTSGGDAAAPIASISKLITAMVILQAKPLSSTTDPGPRITFSKADHALYDKYYVLNATIAPMPTGSILSEHDALETMLVVSACNYAEALADWAYGSPGAFLNATRAWLAAHGMSHTRMVEPTGIDPANTSTPSDLIALGKLALANPAIASMVNKPNLDNVPAEYLHGMGTTNDLLGSHGVDGIKTGTLDPSGSDLLYSATVEISPKISLRVIGVELGGASHGQVDGDVENLLASITAGFHQVALGQAGDAVGTYSTRWGSSARMVLGSSPSVLVWSDTKITSSMTTTTLKTGKDGERVGTVTWKAGPETVTAPVVLRGSIRPPSAWWRLTHPFELGR